MTLHRPLGPTGTPAGVWINDQLARIERALEALSRPLAPDMTLEEMDRLERALVRAHTDNLLRLDRHREEIAGYANPDGSGEGNWSEADG